MTHLYDDKSMSKYKLRNLVGTQGYISEFHYDREDGDWQYSIQKKGRKIWFFYPNSVDEEMDNVPDINFTDFLGSGCVYLQEEGTTIRWKRLTIHAVVHLTDTIAVTGQDFLTSK